MKRYVQLFEGFAKSEDFPKVDSRKEFRKNSSEYIETLKDLIKDHTGLDTKEVKGNWEDDLKGLDKVIKEEGDLYAILARVTETEGDEDMIYFAIPQSTDYDGGKVRNKIIDFFHGAGGLSASSGTKSRYQSGKIYTGYIGLRKKK